MSEPDDYTHERVPWSPRKFTATVIALIIGLILGTAIIKANDPKPDHGRDCYQTPRADYDGGQPVAVICQETP